MLNQLLNISISKEDPSQQEKKQPQEEKQVKEEEKVNTGTNMQPFSWLGEKQDYTYEPTPKPA